VAGEAMPHRYFWMTFWAVEVAAAVLQVPLQSLYQFSVAAVVVEVFPFVKKHLW